LEEIADWAIAIAKVEGEDKFGFTGAPQKMLIYQIGCIVLSYG